MSEKNNILKKLTVGSIVGSFVVLGGCCCLGEDVCYSWDIPESQADCPTGTQFMQSVPGDSDLDGGPGIVDRDGGPGIVDRDGNFITDYCLKPCEGSEVPTGPTIIDWHNPNDHVVAYRRCVDSD